VNGKDYTIGAVPPSYSSYFYPLPISLQDNSQTNQLAVSQLADWITRRPANSPTANYKKIIELLHFICMLSLTIILTPTLSNIGSV